jgi:hypothetical protein
MKEITEFENKEKSPRDVVVQNFERMAGIGNNGPKPVPVLGLGGGIGIGVERHMRNKLTQVLYQGWKGGAKRGEGSAGFTERRFENFVVARGVAGEKGVDGYGGLFDHREES